MTETEFAEWGAKLLKKRPSLNAWKCKLDDWSPVREDWWLAMQRVDLHDADQALISIAVGELDLPEWRAEDTCKVIASWCWQRAANRKHQREQTKLRKQGSREYQQSSTAREIWKASEIYQEILKASGKAAADEWNERTCGGLFEHEGVNT